MTAQTWKWAQLTPDQLTLLSEAERTLGTDYLLVYQPGESQDANRMETGAESVSVAQLNDSQIECLQGLEKRLEAVVVAYKATV
jgi:hypothetical protein